MFKLIYTSRKRFEIPQSSNKGMFATEQEARLAASKYVQHEGGLGNVTNHRDGSITFKVLGGEFTIFPGVTN